MDQLVVAIAGGQLQAAEVDELTRSLRDDLLQLPVSDVRAVTDQVAPPGARGIDPTVVGEIVVLLNSSAALLVSVVSAIRSWRRHAIPGGSIRLKLGDDEIELTGLSDDTEAKLLADWTQRHQV